MVTSLGLPVFDTVWESVQQTPFQLGGSGLLEWAVVFFLLAIVAAIVGARGVAGVTMAVAKWFIIIFLILAILSIFL